MRGSGLLLLVPIVAGGSALLAALLAFALKAANASHRWHVFSGIWFFWSMVAVVGTALPLALQAGNIFLLLIGLFSFYLAWSGLRFARRRLAEPNGFDRAGQPIPGNALPGT